jgi:N-acetylglucosamine kinase-like BadF-type ATPase
VSDHAGLTNLPRPFPLTVTNDALLLSSPLFLRNQPWGILVVAGTGSIVLGVTIDPSTKACHHLYKRGGYGHLFGDVGSGYHLGLTAIRLAAEDYNAGIESEGDGLALRLRETFGVGSTDEIPGRAVCLNTPNMAKA